jgi:hypothetical protein
VAGAICALATAGASVSVDAIAAATHDARPIKTFFMSLPNMRRGQRLSMS